MTGRNPACEPQLRRWLEYVIETAIDWLDDLDRSAEDLEDEDGGAAHEAAL